MTKHDQILQAIRKANPELMELSFGCELQHNSTEILAKIIERQMSDQFFVLKETDFTDYWDREDFEIIGHEPHLEHLLVALGGEYGIAHNGDILQYAGSAEYASTHRKIDLTKPLTEAIKEPQVEEALFNLLCK